MDLLFDACWRPARARRGTKEFVTGNNDADGVYLLLWVRAALSGCGPHLRAKLAQWGGNASGVNVANIDNLGNVHPDTTGGTTPSATCASGRSRQIWPDISDPIMAGLEARAARDQGPLRRLRRIFDICGGNTRVRALQLTGDPWAGGPGLLSGRRRDRRRPASASALTVTPYSRQRACRVATGGDADLRLVRGADAAGVRLACRPRRRTPPALYAEHCAACHGADRLGGMGPALLPENLERLKRADGGRRSSRRARRDADAGLRRQARARTRSRRWPTSSTRRVGRAPRWGEAEIARLARRYRARPAACPTSPQFTRRSAEPVRRGRGRRPPRHHPRRRPLRADRARFPTRFALHGGPKFTPDGRYVFFASRDGWITQVRPLEPEDGGRGARRHQHPQPRGVRRRQATSMVGNYLPHTLVLLDAAICRSSRSSRSGDATGQELAGVGGVRRARRARASSPR